MGRCNKCPACVEVIACRIKHKGRNDKNRRIVKKCEVAHKCTDPTEPTGKRKASELEKLQAAGHGGQIRGEYGSTPTAEEPSLDRTARSARSKKCSYNENVYFDQNAFDEYLSLVNQCSKAAKDATDLGVKAEARSMLPKMKALLNPKVHCEVDYNEATKDSSHVLVQWSSNNPAGKRAFIPSIEERDDFYNALKIYACALDEAKRIPEEYIAYFGEDDGIGIYNELVGSIGCEEKKCLPLVNLCLRAAMQRLSEDLDLWADLTLLQYDRWLQKEMTKRSTSHHGKTSYEMMMVLFGKSSVSAVEKHAPIFSTKKVSKPVPQRQTSPTPTTAEDPKLTRKSKIQRIGDGIRKALIRSGALRGKYRYNNKASEIIKNAINGSTEETPNKYVLRDCRNAARKMEDILFSVGGPERIACTMRYFKDRQAVREDMPLHERTEIDPKTSEEIIHRIRACPDDYNRQGNVTWMDFIKVARMSEKGEGDGDEYGANDGVKFQTEWLPVEGTVPEFLTHLIQSMEAYLPHVYELRLSYRVDRCAERAFLIDPITRDDCPDEFKGVVSEVTDFASDINAKRAHDTTCSFPETHKCEVHHLTFAPKFVTVDEIEKNHPRSAKTLRKRGVDRVLRPENVVVFCFSKAKSSAAYNQQATTNIISIVKTGELPKGSKCEAFLDRKRIPGGDYTGFPDLPEGKLEEWESMSPLFEDVKRWRRSRDGCAAQYQGKGAFFGFQTMNARHGIVCEDRRKVTMHGKDLSDGDGSAVNGMVKGSFHDNYGKGTLNLVRHLAHKHPRPNSERQTRYFGMRGLYATTIYIYMYIPEDGINDAVVSVDGGYSGSSKDHYYRSMGATKEASRLLRRERTCGCKPCLRLIPGCLLSLEASGTLLAGITAKATTVVLKSARPVPAARHTRGSRNPLPDFCKGLSVGENIIVRVAKEEKEHNSEEEYFIAKVEEKAIQLEEGGTYSAVAFKKNDWIVFARWYSFAKTNPGGDRFYTKGYAQWIPCGSIIRTLRQPVKLTWARPHYRLSKELNSHIEQYGDIDY